MARVRIEPLKDEDSAEFFFTWVIANNIGLFAGNWISAQIIEILWPCPSAPPNNIIDCLITNPIPRVIIVGITTGALIGFLQWLILRRCGYRVNWKWVASSSLACAAFPTLGEIARSSQQLQAQNLAAILGAVILGIVQWRILRQFVNMAGWWILANAITGAILFRSITPSPSYLLFTGIILGGVTGGFLIFLMKHPVLSARYICELRTRLAYMRCQVAFLQIFNLTSNRIFAIIILQFVHSIL